MTRGRRLPPVVHQVLVLCLVALQAACGKEHARSSPSAPGATLARLQRDTLLPRTIAPRLSIPLRYRPCTTTVSDEDSLPVSRCGGAADAESGDALLALARDVAAELRAGSEPSTVRAAALLDLAAGSVENSVDSTISRLEHAAREDAAAADALADLSAAYLVRAERMQRVQDVVASVDAAARALARDSVSAAARYNLALALQRLGVAEAARDAWRAYLAVDSTTGWATEARRELEIIGRAVARDDLQRLREHGMTTLLGDWGRAVVRGDDATAARVVVDSLVPCVKALEGGDASLADAVATVRRAHDRAERWRLASAHVAFDSASIALRLQRYGRAATLFRRAREAAASSPALKAWATVQLVPALYQLNEQRQALALAEEVLAGADSSRHPALAGRAHWVTATMLLRRGEQDTGLRHAQHAATLFRQAREPKNVGALEALIAEAAQVNGDDAAYGRLRRALHTLAPYPAAEWRHNALDALVRASLADGHEHAALRFQGEQLAVASRIADPVYTLESLTARSRLLVAHGRHAEATRVLDATEGILDTLSLPIPRDWYQAEVRVQRATARKDLDPSARVAMLDRAVEYLEARRSPVRLIPALLARAQAWADAKRTAAARDDLARAMAMFAQRGVSMGTARERRQLLEQARGVVDQLVLLRLAAGDTAGALLELEQGRDTMAARGALRIPEGSRALVHAVIGDTLLAWMVSAEGIRLVARGGAARTLGAIASVERAFERGIEGASTDADLRLLHDHLVGPFAGSLGAEGAPLAIVSDGEIARVPFAALRDGSGVPLVQRVTLRHVRRLRDLRAPSPEAGEGDALFVADPAFTPQRHPGLPRLPGAAAEVVASAKAYPSSRVLFGPAARAATIAEALPRARMLHFAGHAVFDEDRPERSYLVTATDSARMSERLVAADIARLDLRELRVIVLSACRTLPSRTGRAATLAGLGDAFLDAGAHGVVGSAWRVSDVATSALMQAFHRAYRANGDAPAALRAAQLELLQSNDPFLRSPAAWAGFRYAGH